MNKKQYKEFQKNFKDFFIKEEIDCMSSKEQEQEPYFSSWPCDCCGSPLRGNRQDYIAYNPKRKEIQGSYSICIDCIYYNEYGHLDDLTMLEMKDN